MNMHFGFVAFGLIGGLLALISLIIPYRPVFRQYFFVFLFTVVPLGTMVIVPLGLMFLVGLFKKRAPYSFGAWLARLGDDDVDIVRTYSAGDDGLSAPNSKDWTGHPAPDGGTYLDRHGTISSEAYH